MDPFFTPVTELRPTVLHAVCRHLRDLDWAQDASAETVQAALQRRPDVHEPGRVRAWLLGILRHQVVDPLLQQIGADGVIDVDSFEGFDAIEIGDPCPRSDAMHREADRQFITALHGQRERLPPAHADAFVMRACPTRDTAEICDELAISPGNLCVILHRTRHANLPERNELLGGTTLQAVAPIGAAPADRPSSAHHPFDAPLTGDNMTLNFTRRATLRTVALAAALAGLGNTAFAQVDDEGGSLRHGKLFISTNAPAGNQVLVYTRVTAGVPTLLGSFNTGGNGTGAALGSQGAVTLSRDGRYLFVVNAGSGTLSTFTFGGGTMALSSVVSTQGGSPTSVAEYGGFVYVMNAGGDGGIVGFRNTGGVLAPLADGLRGLSQIGGTAPGQVSINGYGDVLVVAERATNRLTSYSIGSDGTLTRRAVTSTPGVTPFGHAFTPNDTLIVSEAATSSVTSYRFIDNTKFDAPRAVTSALGNGQGAACWVATSPNGRFAFTSNAATNNVSSYAVGRDGRLSLIAGIAGNNGANAGALDLSVSPDGQQLHVFAQRAPNIVTYAISASGGLTALGVSTGMPLGAAGLAAN